jgi:GT2 family glycosyltransferase
MDEKKQQKRKHPEPRRTNKEKIEIPLDTSRSSAVGDEETYNALRADNRVVMRHNIALNLESFSAATETFTPRPERNYASLRPVRPPFFSVIIPNFNGRHHLEALFDALAAQSFADFEVIFADDASSDDSVLFVEGHYADKLNLRLLVNRQNLGFVPNVNAAADAAHGRVLVLLNNDTEPEKGWLAELALAICENPQAAMVASKMLLFDDRDRLHTAGDLLGSDGVPVNRGAWERDTGQYDRQTEIFGGCGGAVAIRREAWRALGGFDEAFWMYMEDVDFAFRAQLSGWKAVFAPRARVYHKVSSSGGDELASFYVGRNTLWIVAKNMPGTLLLKNLPRIVISQLRIALDALRNWRGQAARNRLRGQLAGLLTLPAQLRKRHLIQQRRWSRDDEIAKRLTGQ